MIHSSIDLRVFPADYSAAIENWSGAIGGLPAVYTSFPVTDFHGAGPSGQALLTQTIWLGDADASGVLVLLAGTHGIEGYTGTAVQLDFLTRFKNRRLPMAKNIAVLLVHALTPWGYAWHRRCDENGIDLNRNFIDFTSLPVNSGFLELQTYIHNPDRQIRREAFAGYIRRHGRAEFERAVSGGQYVDPVAPFFGGTEANHGHRVVDSLIELHGLERRRLAVIDIHTGLGPYGYGEIICDHPSGSAGQTTATAWYGAAVTVPERGTSSSVPKLGLLDYAWHRIMHDESCFVTLEFGTYDTDTLFEVLLEDHLFWEGVPPGSVNRLFIDDPEWRRRWHKNRDAMLAHFCPADPVWRESIVFRSRQVIQQALTGLSQ